MNKKFIKICHGPPGPSFQFTCLLRAIANSNVFQTLSVASSHENCVAVRERRIGHAPICPRDRFNIVRRGQPAP